MPEPTLPDIVAAMHATFHRISGIEARPWANDRLWFELAKHGYTAHDVEIFCLWVKSENRDKEPRRQRQFNIWRMFGNVDRFEDDLAMARGWHRNLRPEPTAREAALQDLRPTVDAGLEKTRLNPARSAGEVLGRILRGQR